MHLDGLLLIEKKLDALLQTQTFLGGNMIYYTYPDGQIASHKTYNEWIEEYTNNRDGFLYPWEIYPFLQDMSGVSSVITVKEGYVGTEVIWPVTKFIIENGLNGKDFVVGIHDRNSGATLSYYDPSGQRMVESFHLKIKFIQAVGRCFGKC